MIFTEEQQSVIDVRNKNILVSAAAGSGKTAVLVERILKMILDKENPVDIDKLLVVTFTEAAAAEMRERIRKAIDSELITNPENVNLQKQSSLLYRAQISTIHSLCLNVIKNNFNDIGLDPKFRIADETELKLMQEDVISKLFEEKYESGDENFLKTVDYYSRKAKDADLQDNILEIYKFSEGYPWPEEWLDRCAQFYNITTVEEFNDSEWVKYLLSIVRNQIEDILREISYVKELTLKPMGPFKYADVISSDYDTVKSLLNLEHYDDYIMALTDIGFARIPSKAGEDVDESLKEEVKSRRDRYKKYFGSDSGSLRTIFGLSSKDEIQKLSAMRPYVNTIIELCAEFSRRFEQKRKDKGIISFSDMEHYCLDILYTKDEQNRHVPSKTAEVYASMFEEIMMDEYQDCNRVQELIIESISRHNSGHFNRFMVGDVKQSIYKFRLANPKLFIEKSELYKEDDCRSQGKGDYIRIDLHKNFRSRETVINTVNDLFGQIMHKDVGDVEYDKDAFLNYGADYPPCEGNDTQVFLTVYDNECNDSKGVQEAKTLACQIKNLVGAAPVYDFENKSFRPARYKDIVILVRSMTDVADGIRNVFAHEGIPCVINVNTGFYKTNEIQQVIQLLKVVDNPRQDISMYGVLHSFFGGFSDEEIAILKTKDKENDSEPGEKYLYDSLKSEAGSNPKVKSFLDKLEDYRRRSTYTPIHKLIDEIVSETGYVDYCTALSGGIQRRANVEMLIGLAQKYEATSYKGLFHFVRYIKQLQKIEADSGEAEIVDENADAVRIMTIHKSKGLEFPICILAGVHKEFNKTDLTKSILCDMDFGIGVGFVDLEKRIKNTPLLRRVISMKLRQDMLGEELRILYVALTRAKEKLIISGVVKDEKDVPYYNGDMPYLDRISANSYLQFLAPVLPGAVFVYGDELKNKSVKEAVDRIERRGSIEKIITDNTDSPFTTALTERFNRKYQHTNLEGLIQKTSVSELKKAYLDLEFGTELFKENEEAKAEIVPSFAGGGKEKITGTDRGNAYHKVMELLDFNETDIKSQINLFHEKHLISQTWYEAVDTAKIERFMGTSLAKRMAKAQKEGLLHKEQPFVLGIDASRVKPEYPDDEIVLLQGIIDAFFEEDGKIVLLDYKTDKIESAEALRERYKIQLQYYKEALQNILGKEVSECILYSFSLECEVPVS